MQKRQSKKTIDQYIMDIVRKNNPKTVNELVKLVQQKYPIPENEILERILHLQNQGKIALRKHQIPITPLLRSYIFSTKANWYWTIIAVAAITAALVFTVPENAYPIVYARYVFGSIFVLFLPGYSHHTRTPSQTSGKPIKHSKHIERQITSIEVNRPYKN